MLYAAKDGITIEAKFEKLKEEIKKTHKEEMLKRFDEVMEAQYQQNQALLEKDKMNLRIKVQGVSKEILSDVFSDHFVI